MNGMYNAMFIVLLFVSLVMLDWIYSISDNIVDTMYARLNAIIPNAMTDNAHTMYANVRGMWLNAVTYFLAPFLLLLSFASSFINRHTSIFMYLISSMAVLLITPILIYIFANLFTNLLSVSILNPAYVLTTYMDNFLYILILNMLLSLASFVFVQRQVQ